MNLKTVVISVLFLLLSVVRADNVAAASGYTFILNKYANDQGNTGRVIGSSSSTSALLLQEVLSSANNIRSWSVATPSNIKGYGTSGTCFDISNYKYQEGQSVLAFQCNNQANEKFTFDASAQWTQIKATANTNFCLAPSGTGAKLGSNMTLTACNAQDSRQFWGFRSSVTLSPVAQNNFYLVSKAIPTNTRVLYLNNTASTIDAKTGSTSSKINLQSTSKNDLQPWNFVDGTIRGTGSSNSVCLDVSGNQVKAAAQVIAFSCNSQNNQRWVYDTTNSPSHIRAYSNPTLCLSPSSDNTGSSLVLKACDDMTPAKRAANDQLFYFESQLPTPAPVTQPPVTDAPTSAPVTDAPTSAPVTDAPTSAPVTDAPTSAPVTDAPTSAPVTDAPTSAPVTDAPTSAPVTDAPTSAPVTDAPTSAPVTDAPTSAPVTDAPTSAPVTDAPTSAPVTDAPTSAPVTDAPTDAPVTDAPTDAPVTDAPTSAPVTDAPTSAPVTDAPTSAPVTDAPTSAPVTDAPTDAPVTDAPTDAPVTDAPTDAPVTDAPTSAPVTDAPTSAPVTDAPTDAPTSAPTDAPTPTCPATPAPAPTEAVSVNVDQNNLATFTWTAPAADSRITGYILRIQNMTIKYDYSYNFDQLSSSIQFAPAMATTERTASVAAVTAAGTGAFSQPTTFHIKCKSGRQDVNGQCVVCEAGEYESNGSCVACGAGSSTNNKRGATQCYSCPAGYFSSYSGAYECSACPAGTTSNVDNTICVQCPAGTYAWAHGSSCQSCPGQTEVGATSCLVDEQSK